MTKPLVTRDVEPSALHDLFEAPPRATVAFVDRDGVQLLPVRTRTGAEPHLFAVLADGAPDLEGSEVVLMCDDGAYWFDLRGISVRGVARAAGSPAPQAAGGLAWYTVEPRRILAWDYDTIRQE